ncbi:O-antigen ligase family protein, partial [Brevirhabdus pacifica]
LPPGYPGRTLSGLGDLPARAALTAPLAVTLGAPLVMGSDRPLAWLSWAGVLGLALSLRALDRRAVRGSATPALTALLPVAAAWVWAVWLALEGSADPGASLAGLLRWLSYGALFVLGLELGLAASSEDGAGRRRLASCILLAGAAQGVLALGLLLGGDLSPWGTKAHYPDAATGSFMNPNALAAQLGMAGICGLALMRGSMRTNGWLLLALMLMAAALLATGSRMGVLAALAGGATVCVARDTGRRSGRFPFWSLGLTGAAALVMMPRLADLPADLAIRAELYRQVIEMIALRPWTGYGLDAFATAFPPLRTAGLPPELVWLNPHSTYLSLWVELGLIAGSLPLLALGLIAMRLIGPRAGASVPADPLRLAALGVLVQAGLHASVDFSFEIAANAYLLVLILSLGLTALPRTETLQ